MSHHRILLRLWQCYCQVLSWNLYWTNDILCYHGKYKWWICLFVDAGIGCKQWPCITLYKLSLLPNSLGQNQLNSSSPGQNGRHFADDIFKCNFVNEKFCISIRISLKFVHKDPISHNQAFVWVMAWCRTGDKPLPEPMLIQYIDAYMRH